MNMETNVVLVLLVGLPGSGKTTLCRALKSCHEENQGCRKPVMIHICYDDLIPPSVQRELVELKRSEGQEESIGEEEDERNLRMTGVRSNEEKKSTEKNEDNVDSKRKKQFISKDWKSARREIHAQVNHFLQYVMTGKTDSGAENFCGIPFETLETGVSYIILLDDNFYYRSMRYEFFQLARRHSAAFCQLYLECSTEEALCYSDMRDERVPEGVVMAMAERLQVPQPHLHQWEANTCVLKRADVGQVSQAWEAVVTSFRHGLSPLDDKRLEVAESRQCCSKSVIHQADLCLRAIVKCLVKEQLQQAVKGCTSSAQIAAGINGARQTVLASLREGVHMPAHLVDAITQDNRQEFETFLEAEMKKIIFG